jgi:hypothetical protein
LAFRLRPSLAQFANMRRSSLGSLFPAMEGGRQDLLETLGLQQPLLDVLGNDAVELFHGNARSGQCWAPRLEQHLHDFELGRVDDRRHRHLDDLGLRFALARFPKFGVEAVAADIRRSGQHLVHGIDAPASAVARSDARFIQMLCDRLDAHRP